MTDLKGQLEVMQGIDNGRDLQARQHGDIVWQNFDDPSKHTFNFQSFEYRLKPEPIKWYENIPEGGVLCWIGGESDVVYPDIIIDYKRVSSNPYITGSGSYKEAKSLTKQEIQVFMDNAPEAE